MIPGLHEAQPQSDIDPRLQIGFAALALVLALYTGPWGLVLLAGFGLWSASRCGLSARKLLARLAVPAMMGLVLLLVHLFFYGQTPLFTLQVGQLAVTGYAEGWQRGGTLILRIAAGVALIVYLSATTPMPSLLAALRWYRLPQPLVELLELTYRYIFVLWDEALRVRQAQKTRLGYANWRVGLRSAGSLGGTVLIRAFDRGESLHRSMLCRGYRGEIAAQPNFNPGRAELRQAVRLAAVLVLSLLLGLM